MSHKDCNTKIRVGRRVVGEVRGDVFHKSVYASKHFLREPRAIANDITVLQDAEQAGAVWVHIRDKESGQIYKATIAHIRESGFPINRGWGKQIALPMNGWIKSGQAIQGRLF